MREDLMNLEELCEQFRLFTRMLDEMAVDPSTPLQEQMDLWQARERCRERIKALQGRFDSNQATLQQEVKHLGQMLDMATQDAAQARADWMDACDERDRYKQKLEELQKKLGQLAYEFPSEIDD